VSQPLSQAGHASGGPVVSVIVPTHNYARYLAETVGSVLSQSFGDWECVVVDDGSTDQTQAVLAQMSGRDQRIRVFSQKQHGLSAARNAGLQLSRGRYVQFLDADDLLHEAKLAEHVHGLDANREIDIVYGPTRYFADGEPRDFRRMVRGSEGPESARMSGVGAEILRRLVLGNQMTVAAPLVRRSVFDDVGTFDESLDRLEDWDLWLRCAIAGKRFLFVPSAAPVALIRVHGASLSYRLAPMLLTEMSMRRRLQTTLPTGSAGNLNQRRLDEVTVEIGKLEGLTGNARAGLRYLLPVALSRRHPIWIAWVLAMLLMPIPGTRRLIVALRLWRNRRRRAIG
jgi:glycosyltransferase involved in cell wall biosynthesis